MEATRLPFKPDAGPEPEIERAVRAWNLMGGQLDWVALPMLAELMGEEDLEAFIVRLARIRDWKRDNRD